MADHGVEHTVGGFLVEAERLRIWAEIKSSPWLKKISDHQQKMKTYQSLYCIVFDLTNDELTLDNFLNDFQGLDV